MPDPNNYTITRYDYPLVGGVAAHGFYALERTEPDGTTTPIAALHGMATDAHDNPKDIGLPGDDDTIKVHLYQNPKAPQDGIVQPEGTLTQNTSQPVWPGSIRRADLGPMTQQQATDTFNRMIQGGAAINDKARPYSIFGDNSDTVNKQLGELAHDPSIGKMDALGNSTGQGGELNKPGYGGRILSPDETRAIDPSAPIVSYPPYDPLAPVQTRSVVTRPDGSRTETYDDGTSADFDAAGTKLPPAPKPPAPSGPTSLDDGGAQDGSASASPPDDTGSDPTGAPSLAADDPAYDDGSLSDQDVAELTPNFAPDQMVMNDLDLDQDAA